METLAVDQLVGQTFNNYHVERFIGKGRLNVVYLVRNLSSQHIDALTLYLIPEHFSNEARARFIARFHHYASAIASLSHPAILPVYTFGEMLGCPYLVTAYETHGSLADQQKRDGRYDYQTVLSLIEHFVPGLQYAHEKGVIHGTLRPSLIVLSEEGAMQVAGFGLFHILQLAGIEQTNQPNAHLLSIAGTLLAPPEYVAPEVIQGQPVTVRSDVYALGCILFELLSGQAPSTGTNPQMPVNQPRLQKPPSLRLLRPDLPVGLVSVVKQALEHDPNQRFQQVNELVEAFAQIAGGSTKGTHPLQSSSSKLYSVENSDVQKTPRQGYASNTWQLLPPIITNKVPTVRPRLLETGTFLSREPTARDTDKIAHPPLSGYQSSGETSPENSSSIQPSTPSTTPSKPPVQQSALQNSMPGVHDDTSSLVQAYAWWSQSETLTPRSAQPEEMLAATSQSQQAQKAIDLPSSTDMNWVTGPFMDAPFSNKKPRVSRKGSRKVGRRRVVAALATGGVAVVGTAAYFGLKSLSSPASSQTTAMNGMTNNAPGKAQMPGTNMGNKQSSAQNQQMPNMNMGTLVGKTNQAINTAQPFTNPADGKTSLLIHLPDGKFVAYERACTHVGVNVNYDPGSQKLVCPAHGAIFDPADGAKVLQGPATRPLPPVTIRVNGDGMITVA